MNVDNRLRTQEEKYSSDYSTPYPPEVADALNDLSQETVRDFERPIMMVPDTQRKLYYQLVKLLRPNYILEIGTFTGATAIAMACAFPSSSKVVSLDIDPKCMQVARKYINRLQYGDRVELRVGPALVSLKALKQEHSQRQYDLIFIVLYRGYVHREAGYEEKITIKKDIMKKWTKAVCEFNEYVLQNPSLQVVMLPVFNGVSFISKSP
ncbi:S-adenosyl-L-methionine-dependent methyltransferase [Phascolomyces articulosus]|uniref:S-adenosyl-L-methionine-dependent methyltransferase n=1 Tax=Phascolomyces articulosus TaxID=60185 RepID=A0AAD5K988_9FUNG|nr:S-adenosyl-L-methionine-dependent methyltransferase [Phascolomyces articulosus]